MDWQPVVLWLINLQMRTGREDYHMGYEMLSGVSIWDAHINFFDDWKHIILQPALIFFGDSSFLD
ncbi:hypothetical protein QJS10_CPA03g00853 [Acorus calamus]|uniref:Uncharacterized protein n=1 Tax=Acorus calamus TaxID=4465 RepID=A0AAV9F824_ACOCL|nr:hypothetical protein QJS10_CPA03g00853 [Acorus calamus]